MQMLKREEKRLRKSIKKYMKLYNKTKNENYYKMALECENKLEGVLINKKRINSKE